MGYKEHQWKKPKESRDCGQVLEVTNKDRGGRKSGSWIVTNQKGYRKLLKTLEEAFGWQKDSPEA